LVDPAQFLLEAADHSGGEISGTLRAIVDDWRQAWVHVAESRPQDFFDAPRDERVKLFLSKILSH
jgi:hypothetical protein